MKQYWLNRLVFASSLAVILAGCSSPVEKDQIEARQELHDTLVKAAQNNYKQLQQQAKKSAAAQKISTFDTTLIPSLHIKRKNNPYGIKYKKFNISVKNEPAQQFFLNLMKGTGRNIVVSPKITGNITLSLANVTIITVLDAIRDLYGYQWQQVPYGFKVYPLQLETEIFKVNHLNIERKGLSNTSISRPGVTSRNTGGYDNDFYDGQNSNVNTRYRNRRYPYWNNHGNYDGNNAGSAIKTSTEAKFWERVEKTIWALIGKEKGKSVTVNPTSGIVVVRAYPLELKQVDHFLHSSQQILGRQVMLEAKILELTLSKRFQFGINWDLFGNAVGKTANIGDSNAIAVPESAPSDIFKLNVKDGSFGAAIRLLSQQGQVTVLSSPRISTTNNQKAIIKVGSDQFFLTGLNAQSLPTGSNSAFFNDVSLRPFFSGVALGVTPQISDNGTILMHIHPVVSRTEQSTLNVGVGGDRADTSTNNELRLPTAKTVIRESDSVVKAKNNQVIIIGGLMENSTNVNRNTPGKINANFPNDSSRKTELIILLKPTYIQNDTWKKELDKLAQTRFKPPMCSGKECIKDGAS